MLANQVTMFTRIRFSGFPDFSELLSKVWATIWGVVGNLLSSNVPRSVVNTPNLSSSVRPSEFKQLKNGLRYAVNVKLLSQHEEGKLSAISAASLSNAVFHTPFGVRLITVGGGRGSVQVDLVEIAPDGTVDYVKPLMHLSTGTPADVSSFITDTLVPLMESNHAVRLILYSGFYLSILKSKESWADRCRYSPGFVKPDEEVPIDGPNTSREPVLSFPMGVVPAVAIRTIKRSGIQLKVGFMARGCGDIGSGKVAAYGPNGIVEEPFEKGNIDDAIRAVHAVANATDECDFYATGDWRKDA